MKEDYGFIFQYIEKLIDWLYSHFLYNYLRAAVLKLLRKKELIRSFADFYVLLNTTISFILAILILKLRIIGFWQYIIFIFSFCRVSEITIHAIYSYFTHKFTKNDKRDERIASARRKLFLLFFNMIEIINSFIIWGAFVSFLNNTKYWTSSFFEAFKANFYCFLTQNPDMLIEKSIPLDNLAFFEVLLGLFFIIICFTQILSSFSSLNTLEDDEA